MCVGSKVSNQKAKLNPLECTGKPCYLTGYMPELRNFLQQTFAQSGGVMSFEDFMAMALYHHDHGYYTAEIRDIGGRNGDFATSATLSSALGQAIARWIKKEAAVHSFRKPIDLIEIGGGNGALAEAVLQSLGWWGRRQFRFHLVEISPVLKRKQQGRLARLGVAWHETVTAALQECGGQALLFSNELVDAFPAKWLRWNAGVGIWEEIVVAYDPVAGLSEQFCPRPLDLDWNLYSAMSLQNPGDGQRIEIRPSFRCWMQDLICHWTAGSMLTIDYGAATAEKVYHRRPGGTMRGYFRQERIEGGGVYARFGRQDLTADVNFADLIAWGKEYGLDNSNLSTQQEFLTRFAAGGCTMATEDVGSAFQVLEQRRGLPDL